MQWTLQLPAGGYGEKRAATPKLDEGRGPLGQKTSRSEAGLLTNEGGRAAND